MPDSLDPLVSILLPARDAAATLPAALRSVQRQTLARFECLVVDDGSHDATAAVVAACAVRDHRVRLLPRPRAGLVAALNAGLAEARAPLVARMDADDLMHRRRLELQCAAMAQHADWSACGTRTWTFPRRGLREGRLAYEQWLNTMTTERVAAEAYVECPLAHPTLMARTAVLRMLGYRDRGWPEDWDLVLRLLAAGHHLGMVERRLLAWRDAPERLSRRGPAFALERFTACRASFLAEGFLAGHQRYVLWGYGATGRALRRALLAHGKEPSLVVELHPGRLGNRIHGATVVPPQALAALARPRPPVVASVAGAGARALIRAALVAMGFTEGEDFVCAA